MAPFAEVLRPALNNLIFQFRGMTAGVTGGYEEVARTIVRLSGALDNNNTALGELTALLPYIRGAAEEEPKRPDASPPSASTTIAGVSPFHRTGRSAVYTPAARAPTVASKNGDEVKDGDPAPTTFAEAEVTVDGAILTPAQRSAISIRANRSLAKGAKYGVPEESAAAMITSIEQSGYPAISTRNARRNAFLSIILEKGIELRNRMSAETLARIAAPGFDDSIAGRNVARFRNFLEALDPGSRGGRAMADVISSTDGTTIAEQTHNALVYLMGLINTLPRRTPATARAPGSASHSRHSSASSGIDLFGDAAEGADEHKAE
jgi:hypothetical protein